MSLMKNAMINFALIYIMMGPLFLEGIQDAYCIGQ